MKSKQPSPGDIVECSFLDHVEDGDCPIEFTVWGMLESMDKRSLVISSWAYQDGKKRGDYNEKRWTIVRPCITGLAKLKKA